MIDLESKIKKEIGNGVGVLKKWSWALTAHTKKPLFEKEMKHKRKWWGGRL